ncbi:hypothetical protein RND81_12G107100 [Saponaria officinalis]|uniref:Leucine-rich repeat-containing N-terminal plant-type domain-containing protein n=1 Tax=Saponaria officinalis TaxID=3572 RepID=A0AAW1H908_SAPOF
MLEITSIHERQHFCVLFLVVMLLCFFTNNLSLSSKLNTTRCFENDRKFLLNIHQGCSSGYNISYIHECCDWPGITCSSLTGRVIGLDLWVFLDNCFWGAEYPTSLRPSSISLKDLVSLQVDMDGVTFSKGFSSFITSFPNLKHLYLESYEEPGIAIPMELGNLTRLETFEVNSYSNTMYANTLKMFSRLSSLKRLVLSSVFLKEATDWLNVVSNLSHLEHLDLSFCRLPRAIYHSQRGVNSSKSLSYLDFSFNNLDASSSWSWILNHSSLNSLLISHNQLAGSIPNNFKRMTSLSHLDLSYNRLDGQLPSSLLGLCGLRNLDVSQNRRLQGDLSRIFQSLSCAKESLTVLSLQRNLFSGLLPDLTMFSRLSKLTLHSNRLNGSLPSYANRSTMASSLTVFDVHNNQLTGSVPDLSALRSLRVLKLQNNKLNGSVHPGLGQLSRLKHLDVSSNSLKGDLGISHFANLSSLRYFDISFNSLTMNIGCSWVPPFRLETIGLASCNVGSRFPEWLRTQTNYSRLDLSNSGISDTVPFWFWNLSSVATFISLSRNRLHGKLPMDLSFKYYMNPAIDLSFNFLEGTIPSFFGNTVYLNLSRNSFYGPVSFLCLNSFTLGIDLSHNIFSGNFPNCWSNFETMSVMDLSNNSFSGQLPCSLGNLSSLQSLHLRHNKFSGKLPMSLCNLTYLFDLDLGDNLFTGEIPGCLGTMLKNLTILSLRNNSISGNIPPQLCHPSVQILDLSTNNISGVIPKCLCDTNSNDAEKEPTCGYV